MQTIEERAAQLLNMADGPERRALLLEYADAVAAEYVESRPPLPERHRPLLERWLSCKPVDIDALLAECDE